MIRIPLLHLGEYAPLKEALVACMNETKMKRTVNFSVGFYGQEPLVPQFFVQGFIPDDETLQLEAARKANSLPSAQLETNDLFMKATGWSLPDAKDTNNPNYVRRIKIASANFPVEAEKLIGASIAIGHLTPSAWMMFEPDSLKASITAAKTFWHHDKHPDLLCLPGQNIGQTTESK